MMRHKGGKMKTGRRLLSRFTSGKGAAAVELALVIPLFMLMTFGLLEFGHAWYIQHGLTNASREGARYGIVYRNIPGTSSRQPPEGLTNPTIEGLVKNYLGNFFSTDFTDTVQVSLDNGGATAPGTPLTVTVSVPKNWFILQFLIPGITAFTLEAKTVMEIE